MAIAQAVVHRLGHAPLLGGHLGQRHTEHLGRRLPVDVHAARERVHQHRIAEPIDPYVPQTPEPFIQLTTFGLPTGKLQYAQRTFEVALREIHKRLIAETDREQLTPDHRFKTRAEMAVLFADIPEALASTVEIAERCSFRPMTRKPILPFFTVGAAGSSDAAAVEAAELKRQAEEGLAERLRVHGLSQGTTQEEYSKRLAFELGVLEALPYQQVGAILEIPVGTVKSRIFNAVRTLRRLLPDLEEEPRNPAGTRHPVRVRGGPRGAGMGVVPISPPGTGAPGAPPAGTGAAEPAPFRRLGGSG